MKNTIKWILAAVGFMILLAGGMLVYRNLSDKYSAAEEESGTGDSRRTDSAEISTEKPKVEMRDITVVDWDGKEVQLSGLKGKPIFLNFWASKCSPCRSEMADFQKVYEIYKDKVQFVLVDAIGLLGETEEAGRSYIQEKGYTFPVYFDRDLSAVMTYGITSIPTSFFIDSEGYIVSGYRGMMDESIVTRLLNSIAEEK